MTLFGNAEGETLKPADYLVVGGGGSGGTNKGGGGELAAVIDFQMVTLVVIQQSIILYPFSIAVSPGVVQYVGGGGVVLIAYNDGSR